jgi:hypothetical protein
MTRVDPMFKAREFALTARQKAFSWICKALLTALTHLLCGTGVGVA